jgi:hypothetical protein
MIPFQEFRSSGVTGVAGVQEEDISELMVPAVKFRRFSYSATPELLQLLNS